jgi:predicted nuclease of restriction endonuclease-like RecB superfamily
MERKGDTNGWLVEREPEPIVHGPTVLVPDFALTRSASSPDSHDETRVFVEVIGFWTPAYRERKKVKLLALDGMIDLVLVVQDQLASDFESMPYPVLRYKRRPSAHDLVMLLERTHPAAPSASRVRPRAPSPPDDTARETWEALFGKAAGRPASQPSSRSTSASPAARDTPAVG